MLLLFIDINGSNLVIALWDIQLSFSAIKVAVGLLKSIKPAHNATNTIVNFLGNNSSFKLNLYINSKTISCIPCLETEISFMQILVFFKMNPC